MAGFRSRSEVSQAIQDGKTWTGMWRRTAPALLLTTHSDMSYGAGGPPANYYASAPGVWQTLSQYDGIDHGPDTSSGEKFLRRAWAISAAANSAMHMTLCDYLAYVPFLDGDETAEQVLPDYVLPRYSDGSGVQVMLIVQGSGTTYSYVSMRYLNQDGVERTTDLFRNRAAMLATPGSNALSIDATGSVYGIFMRLEPGDTGVRAVKSIRLDTSSGAIFAVVMVKPLCVLHTKDNSLTPYEIDFLERGIPRMPRIRNGAYLNFVGRPAASGTPGGFAELNFVWP